VILADLATMCADTIGRDKSRSMATGRLLVDRLSRAFRSSCRFASVSRSMSFIPAMATALIASRKATSLGVRSRARRRSRGISRSPTAYASRWDRTFPRDRRKSETSTCPSQCWRCRGSKSSHASQSSAAAKVAGSSSTFLDELAALRRQQVEHVLGRPAKLYALGTDDDRPVDEDGMRQHHVDKLVFGQLRIVKPQFGIGRSLLAQKVAGGDPHAGDELGEHRPARRCLQILDDMRLDAGIADHGQRVARRAAVGVVIDDDVHNRAHAALGRGDVDPSLRPISRSFVPRAALSRLSIGSAAKTEIRVLR